MIELIKRSIDSVEAPVAQIKRADATPTYEYNHELNRVPYFYGVYGDKEGTEKQGLIQGSTGWVKSVLASHFEGETAEEILKGRIPEEARYMVDTHTVAIRDGNGAIPVGLHTYNEDENGEIIDSVLWYGAAAPTSYVKHLIEENGSGIVNIKDGTNYGLYQESEKDDTAVNLKFTDIKLEDKSAIAKTYNRTQTGKTAVAFGSSVATGDRAFAAGSSNVAAGGKSVALGCDNYCGNNQSIALGYANYSAGSSSVALGHRNCATGAGAFAAGTETIASGAATTAFGTGSIASGIFSFAAGNQSRAAYDNQFIVGKFNTNRADTFFEVGNGDDNENRSTAFAVTRDGGLLLKDKANNNYYKITIYNGQIHIEEAKQ